MCSEIFLSVSFSGGCTFAPTTCVTQWGAPLILSPVEAFAGGCGSYLEGRGGGGREQWKLAKYFAKEIREESGFVRPHL